MALEKYNIALGAIEDENGKNYISGKAVYIRNKDTNALINIYQDQAGNMPIPQNGVNNVSDNVGMFSFWVEAGRYKAVIDAIDYYISVLGIEYFQNEADAAVAQAVANFQPAFDDFLDDSQSTFDSYMASLAITGQQEVDQLVADLTASGNAQFAAAISAFNDSGNAALTNFNNEKNSALSNFNAEGDTAIGFLKASQGFHDVGTFAAGFVYEKFNDVGRDDNGNPWVYIGDESNYPVTVAAGTDPSAFPSLYAQRGYSDHAALANRNQADAHDSDAITNTDGLTAQDTHDATKAILIAQGLSGNFGFFEKGFAYNEVGDVGIDADGNMWTYSGSESLPFEVQKGGNPDSNYSRVLLKMPAFKNVSEMKAFDFSGIPEGTRIEWQGYYSQSDGGSNWGVLRFGTHIDDGGSVFSINANTYIKANITTIAGVGKFGALPYKSLGCADNIQKCIDYSKANKKIVGLPPKTLLVEKKIDATGGVEIKGAGRDLSIIESNGDYTVFEMTLDLVASNFSVVQKSGIYQGIAFGNKRTNGSDNQSAYSSFYRISVRGYDFSWWIRASIWMSWEGCYSKSLVGIRFARNEDPYDVTSDAPESWNIYSPRLGWFHNVGTIKGVVFEDLECGIYGCAMSYHISACTTQRQNGSKESNKILPVSEERTGIWLESGRSGTKNAWGNSIESHYAEACKRPFYIQDQKSALITTAFVQGGTSSAKYLTPLHANNSGVTIEGFTGQDWFEWRTILQNDARVYGKTAGAVTGNASLVEDTSMLYENTEQERYTRKYRVESLTSEDSFTIPLDLLNQSHYDLYIGGIYDGASLRHATYDIFKWSSDGLTSVILRSGQELNFSVSVSNSNIVINKTGARKLNLDIVVREVSNSATMTINLAAD